MKLFTKMQHALLLEQGIANQEAQGRLDLKPVVKLFTPDAQCTWLLSELDPDRPEVAFGLCDLGIGFPELGFVSLDELQALRGQLDLPVERDLHFIAEKTMSEYAKEARRLERIAT